MQDSGKWFTDAGLNHRVLSKFSTATFGLFITGADSCIDDRTVHLQQVLIRALMTGLERFPFRQRTMYQTIDR
ncbi:MAG: hypothetical protein RJA81_1389 [Planctomycetota bacterium]